VKEIDTTKTLLKARKNSSKEFVNSDVTAESADRLNATPYGGLTAAHVLVKRVGLDREIDSRLGLLGLEIRYSESDHVLTHVYNLYLGGTNIEDISILQASPQVRAILGAQRIPDPTTAGDFLRRFAEADIWRLHDAMDAARVKVWKRLPKKMRKRATIDFDSKVKEVYGRCKEGADFSYNGKWSYHPHIVTLSETREILCAVNRPGNASPASGAEDMAERALKLTEPYFEEVFARADSAYYDRKFIRKCEERGAKFTISAEGRPNLIEIAASLPESEWKPYNTRDREGAYCVKRRRKRRRWEEEIARRRRYRALKTVSEEVSEFRYTPTGLDKAYRMIVKRQKVKERDRQLRIFEHYEYRFVITDIERWSAEEVLRFAYGRCGDQENAIEQLTNALHALRMPTGELLSNWAFLTCGALAWNLKSWLALTVLPRRSLNWEWKRFRYAFVYLAASVVRTARRVIARFSASSKQAAQMVAALRRLHTFVFR
jgi:hypothetical protein